MVRFYILGSLPRSLKVFPKIIPPPGCFILWRFLPPVLRSAIRSHFLGRIGDIVGRKYAFLVTLVLMGGATTAIGLLPTYETIGIAAPLILVVLRLTQGLALGGEYGGAATYISEHSPDGRRGFYTSFIQTTATSGLFFSLGVIMAVRSSVGETSFQDWGWNCFCCRLFWSSFVHHPYPLENRLFLRTEICGRHLRIR
jgi:MFS family permease